MSASLLMHLRSRYWPWQALNIRPHGDLVAASLGGSLSAQIAQLRARGCDDLLAALRQASADPQALVDELAK